MRDVVRQAAGEETREAVLRLLGTEPERDVVAARVLGAIGAAEADGGREETFWAFRKLLEAVARERPLIVLFEDIHWAEPTFLDFLEHLADGPTRASRARRLLGATRPAGGETWLGRGGPPHCHAHPSAAVRRGVASARREPHR